MNLFKKTISWFLGKAKYLAVLGMVFLPKITMAQEFTSSQLGGGAVGTFQSVIANFLLWLVSAIGSYILLPLTNLVAKIISYNDFLGSYAVEIGWPLVRDLSNMFFVVFLLIIAFATILNISQYQYKNNLFKLLLMAVLINFSKTIFGFLIDIGQVIMFTFVNAFRDSFATTLTAGFGLTDILSIDPAGDGSINKTEIFGSLILALVMIMIASGLVLAYVAVLLYRIISLWVLIILSPLAFLFSAFSGTAKYASEVWSRFAKQLSVGVILAFFLWLALYIISVGFGIGSETTTDTPAAWERLYTFIISVALLWVALEYSQQAGGFAGKFAGQVSGKLSDWGSKSVRAATYLPRKAVDASKFGIKRGAQWAERRVLDYSTNARKPQTWLRRQSKYLTKAGWEGFTRRGDELLEGSRRLAAAASHDQANKIFSNIVTSHAINESERQSKQSAEDYSISGLEDLKVQLEQILLMKAGRERDMRLDGLLSTASLEAWFDDIESIPAVFKQLMTADELKQVEDRTREKQELLEQHSSKEKVEEYTEVANDLVKEGQLDKSEVEDYVKQQIKVDVDLEMKKKYGSANPLAAAELTGRQKQGRFFEWLARGGNMHGEINQETLNLLYNHEKNAINNGHAEDAGFVRVAEKDEYYKADLRDNQGNFVHKKGELQARKGELRILDYQVKDPTTGYTEADVMGLTELGKVDSKKISRFQKHSFAPVMGDGSLGLDKADAYYKAIIRMAGGSDEIYKLTPNGRSGNQMWGSSATVNPRFKEADDTPPIIQLDPGKWRGIFNIAESSTERKMLAGAYNSLGATFVDKMGRILDARSAPKEGGYMIMNTLDKNGKKITAGINILTGKVARFNQGVYKDKDKDIEVKSYVMSKEDKDEFNSTELETGGFSFFKFAKEHFQRDDEDEFKFYK